MKISINQLKQEFPLAKFHILPVDDTNREYVIYSVIEGKIVFTIIDSREVNENEPIFEDRREKLLKK